MPAVQRTHRALADEWTVLIVDGVRLFVARDVLMDDGYATRVDVGVDDRTGWHEIRLGPLPAGGRLQLAPGLVVPRSDQFPQLDTEQFRAQVPGDRLQVINHKQVLRALAARRVPVERREPVDPWADTEGGEHRA